MTSPLIIVCDWLPPEFGAVGQYQLRRAREAAIAGRRAVLIGLGKESSITEERPSLGAAPLTIVRLAAQPADRSNLFARALWALSINVSLLAATARAARKAPEAEILVTGSPPFLSYLLILWALVFRRRGRLTYRITDFYPETAIATGRMSAARLLLPLVHGLRRQADALEALSECQRQRLLEFGVKEERIVIHRDESPVAFSAAVRPINRPFPPDTVILLYSGNLGIAHDIETFAEAYRRHIQDGANRVRLWLNATGVQVKALVDFCTRHSLPYHTTPPGPLDGLASVLRTADMHLVTLKDPFWGYVIPSKIYACLESGRPTLYVGPSQSDVHALVAKSAGSFSVRNGDVEACLAALELAANPDRSALAVKGIQ